MSASPIQEGISSASKAALNAATTLGLSNSDYIAISAALVALFALFATIYQAYLTRNHNRLSVKPHLVTTKIFFEDKPVSIWIENHGPGLAVIKSVTLTYEDKDYLFNSDQTAHDFLELIGVDAKYFHLDGDSPIGVGSKLVLIEFRNEKGEITEELYNNLSKILLNTTVKATYECVYGVRYNLG